MQLINPTSKASKLNYLPQCWYGVCSSEYFSGISNFDTAIGKVQFLISFATGFAALVAVGFLVYGAYTFIMSAGEPERIEKGGKIVTHAIVGLIIIFIARLIVAFVIDRLL